MKPHLCKAWGVWHCQLKTKNTTSRAGVGYTAQQAYDDWLYWALKA